MVNLTGLPLGQTPVSSHELRQATTITPQLPGGLIDTLHTAQNITVLTGAGVSAESGLPTFRDAMTGLWAQYRPEDLATPEAFRRDPKLVWNWYAWRRERASQAAPNPAHLALAAMARHVPNFTLITQNVDGLHQRAGSPNVIELHGNIHRAKCFDEKMEVKDSWQDSKEVPPHCFHCGGLLRPAVVWFGETLPEGALETAIHAAGTCSVFLSIGTSGMVEPAASLARIASQMGATVAIINLDVSNDETTQRYEINGRAGEILPALLKSAWPDGAIAETSAGESAPPHELLA